MNEVFYTAGRHELKHSLNYCDYTVLKSRIQNVLAADRDEYTVHSLYFDTPGDRALLEKINGVNRREKFRIRYYDDDTSFIRLEKKSKINGRCHKQQEIITADEAKMLATGDFVWKHGDTRVLLLELYVKMKSEVLRPKSAVVYTREAFTYPAARVRITFDREIQQVMSFFAKDSPRVPVGDELVLMEVKFDAFLPSHIAKLLQISGRRATACSKYAMSRIYR
ncbi:MAG: polyphosphate polymerase domain-containing protein [Clostridiales bacterium]|jgi:hypothetical protein|nr:polyphosphate polymerase domain-containing protein [Clostridiales bacterium]